MRNKIKKFFQLRKHRYIAVVAAFGVLLVGCIFYIIGYYKDQRRRLEFLEQLRIEAEAEAAVRRQVREAARRMAGAEAEAAAIAAAEEARKHTCPYDFELLYEENPDIYAWVLFEAGGVDYPVLQNDRDDYYLNRNVDLSSGYPGCIYSNDNDAKDFSDGMTVLYGHNMKSGSMFGQLDELRDKEFDRDEEKLLYTYEPDKMQTWELYAAVEFSDVYLPDTYSDRGTGIKKFGEAVKAKAEAGLGRIFSEEEITEEDRLLVLSTCVASQSSKRYLVVGRFLEETGFFTPAE